MLKVLWLCSWYPNKLLPYEGDFIQRHAQAASLANHIHVIKLTPEPEAKGVSKIVRAFQQWPNLTETFIYYPRPTSIAGKMVSYFRWYSLYKYAVENYMEKNGKPDLVHVHIPFKSGVIARLIKRKYGIPYVVTEHWGGYNNIIKDNFKKREPWFKDVIKKTLKEASGLHSVSDYLGRQINELVLKKDYVVIPNVVNTAYFSFISKPKEAGTKFKLLHISSGADVKNIDGLLSAFNQLNRDKYSLTIIGLPVDQNEKLQKLHPGVEFGGIIPYAAVAGQLALADALVIFSNIENSPCVIGEALCCGIPVIATRVGGIPELLNDTNSILVDPGEESQLISAIEHMKSRYDGFHRENISLEAGRKFSYGEICVQTSDWYQSIAGNFQNL